MMSYYMYRMMSYSMHKMMHKMVSVSIRSRVQNGTNNDVNNGVQKRTINEHTSCRDNPQIQRSSDDLKWGLRRGRFEHLKYPNIVYTFHRDL